MNSSRSFNAQQKLKRCCGKRVVNKFVSTHNMIDGPVMPKMLWIVLLHEVWKSFIVVFEGGVRNAVNHGKGFSKYVFLRMHSGDY